MQRYSYEWIVKRYGEPVFRFRPEGDYSAFKEWDVEDVPNEILVVSLKDKHISGVMVFSNFGGEKWQPNYGDRFVVEHLLKITGNL